MLYKPKLAIYILVFAVVLCAGVFSLTLMWRSQGVSVVNLDQLTPSDVIMQLNNYHWDQDRENVLILDVTISNHWRDSIPVFCQLHDAHGNTYFDEALTNIPTDDTFLFEGVRGGETRRGKMQFLVTGERRGLNLQCGKNLIVQID